MKKFFAIAWLLALAPLTNAWAAPCPAIPALPDTERRTEYTGIVAQTGPFNVGFQLYGDSTDYSNWLEIWVNGVKKVGTVDYTVATASGPALGAACLPITNAQVTFLAAQSGTIEIVGARRPRRTSQLSENAGVTAHAFNQLNSDIIAIERERWDALVRSLRAPPGETLSVLQPAATRANKFLIFDSNGNPSLTSPTPGLGNVTGPAISTIGGFAIWTNTVGTALGDAGTSDVFFGSGRPWCDVRAKLAKGDGATDDTAAFTACQTALVALGGGTIYVPNGNYCTFTGLTFTGLIRLAGEAEASSIISACGHNVTTVTMNAGQNAVENLTILGPNLVATTGNALTLGTACVECKVRAVTTTYGLIGIEADAPDHHLDDVKVQLVYGSALVRTTAGGRHWGVKADQGFTISQPAAGTTFSAWTGTHSYAANSVVTLGGFYLQTAAGGTSAGSSPTIQPYGTNITDGTVTWQLVSPVTYYALMVDGGTSSLTVEGMPDYSGSFKASVAIVNTNAGTMPQDIRINDATFQSVNYGVWVTTGANIKIKGGSFNGAVDTAGRGIFLDTSFVDTASIEGNSFRGYPTGIYYGGGKNVSILNNSVYSNGIASTIGVFVGAARSNFTIDGLMVSTSTTWGATATGVQVAAGASDFYDIVHINCAGVSTACVTDAGSGAHKTVESNSNAWTITQVTLSSTIFAGSSSGATILQGSAAASGTLTLPAATDQIIARATTDTLTNKTYDTAGTGNVFKINGTTISAVTGTGAAAVLASSPTITTPLIAEIDGGTAAGSSLALKSTTNVSPSGDSITFTAGGSVRYTILSNGNLGFGTETNPQFPFIWSANSTAGATVTGASLTGPVAFGGTGLSAGWNAVAVAGAGVNSFNRINNTLASPSNLASGDVIGQLSYSGWGNGAFQAGKLRLAAVTSENWSSATNLGSFFEFDTTPAGSGTRAQSMRVMAGVIFGTGTIDPGLAAVSYNAPVVTGTAPTMTGTCAVTSQTGGNTSGTFTASGACAGGTYIMTFATTTPTGWACHARDRTTPADTVNQNASTTTTATFIATTANSDVVGFTCNGY